MSLTLILSFLSIFGLGIAMIVGGHRLLEIKGYAATLLFYATGLAMTGAMIAMFWEAPSWPTDAPPCSTQIGAHDRP